MNDQINNQNPKKRSVRSLALAGTALALVLGGAVIGGASLEIVRPNAALADAVSVQGVEPASFADVVDKVRPAVVSVRVKSTADDVSADDSDTPFFDFPQGTPMDRFFKQFRQQNPNAQRPQRQQTSLGSGFFISEDGYVVTNNHVVDKETQVTVIMDDGTELNAKVIGVDTKTDLALLKVDGKGQKFTYVKFSDAEPRVGDWVVAVGNPFGLGGTVTAGIISAHGRQIGAGPYDDFLQIDAAVNRGNSGGPAFNAHGEVVGVNTAIFSPSGGNVGIAFAIPASTASGVINQIEQHGSVTRGWLGVQIQPISQGLADSMKLDSAAGALVNDVTAGSPAAKIGFKAGDAITAVDGKPVKDSRDLALRISALEPGKTIKVTYWRDGASHDVDVTIGTFPTDEQLAAANPKDKSPSSKEAPATSMLSDFGLSIAPSDDNTGVVVSDVDPNGQAAELGLQSGDVILSVGDSDVSTPADVESKIAAAKKDGLKAVRLRVKSGDTTQFVALTFATT
ncbi:MAG: Do family serine endopeptidase [Bauldia sp.]